MTNLAFTDLTTGEVFAVGVHRVLVAGFTGRDEAAVKEHIEELAELGVPVPDRTPTLYPLSETSVSQSIVLVVSGNETSGEVEPVLVRTGGRTWLTVGSDHTDRAVETVDIHASKAVCGKIVGTSAVPLDTVDDPDRIVLRSTIGHEGTLYQDGTMAALRPIDDLLDHLRTEEGVQLEEGDVLFLGTVPVAGTIRPSDRFRAALEIPGSDTELALDYRVLDVSSLGRPPFAKPELEFTAVESFDWIPVEGVPGQHERILAPDAGNAVATRMLRFEPGTDTRALGPLRHDFWEEVYILEGELHDLTLDRTFPAGTYACRPPGMPHGPWTSPNGCVTFEVRYGAR